MASLLNFHALPPPNEHPSLFHEYFKLCKGNHLSFGVLSSATSNHVEWCCKTPFRHFWQCMMSSWEGGGGVGKTFFCYVWSIIALFTLLKRRGVKKKLLESIMPQLWLVYAQFFFSLPPSRSMWGCGCISVRAHYRCNRFRLIMQARTVHTEPWTREIC